MTTICINGGSIAGLTTALLLGADGHDVTVIERDPAPPSRDPEACWTGWERRSVRQFRQTHTYHARSRQLFERKLPHVWARLLEAGVTEHSLAANPPTTVTDRSPRPGDDEPVLLFGRRTTVESVLRHAAEDDPRVEVLAGVTAKGLLTEGTEPRVVGLATSLGSVRAELVVDCGGPRSAVGDWLDDAGARSPAEEAAEYRIAYWTQWFRAHTEVPTLAGIPAVEIGPLEVIRLPADNRWFSITVVAVASDARFRVLADHDVLLRFLARLELTRDWVDPAVAEPVGGIVPMVAPVDCRRRFVVDGTPCAAGLTAVGDSIGASNPTLARGTTFAFMQAVALRDVLRSDPDPATATLSHHEMLEAQFEPWWQDTVAADQAHLARMRAAVDGSEVPVDQGWAFLHAAHHDPELWRLLARVVGLLEHPAQLGAHPEVPSRIGETMARVGPPQITDLDVQALLAP